MNASITYLGIRTSKGAASFFGYCNADSLLACGTRLLLLKLTDKVSYWNNGTFLHVSERTTLTICIPSAELDRSFNLSMSKKMYG